jgi:hypothetical protein
METSESRLNTNSVMPLNGIGFWADSFARELYPLTLLNISAAIWVGKLVDALRVAAGIVYLLLIVERRGQ